MKNGRVSKSTAIGIVLMLALILSVVSSNQTPLQAAEKVIVLKAVDAWSTNLSPNKWYKIWIDEVNSQLKGRLQINLLGGPEVIPLRDQWDGIRRGIVDINQTAASFFAGEVFEASSLEAVRPDIDYWLQTSRIPEIRDTINAALRKKSQLYNLGYLTTGYPFHIMTSKPLTSLNDLKGLKLRCSGITDTKGLESLGVTPVVLPSSEVYTALKTGVIDGAIRGHIDAVQQGEADGYRFWFDPPMRFTASGTYIATRVWDTLPEDIKKVLLDTMRKTEEQSFAGWKKWNDQYRDEMIKKYGCTFRELTPDEQKKAVTAMRKIWIDLLKPGSQYSSEYGAKLATLLEKHVY